MFRKILTLLTTLLLTGGFAEMTELKLYMRKTCPFCQKVATYLKEKGRKIEMVDIGEDDTAREELIKNGGKRQVPCLFIDGKPMYESNDIIQWLDKN
ncbi:MAG: glutaredoxin [Simkaniaceae bacterium]|nr:glutaredoxin [Simkaniaceae bacterium]